MRVIDIFAGCGGLSLGLAKAGLEVVGAIENWQPALNIYRQNFNHPIFDLDLSDVESAIRVVSEMKPDMIAGGPPCQDFSSAGKRDENLGRADLTIAFAKIVLVTSPEWFLMENVDLAIKSKAYNSAKHLLSSEYGVTEMVLDASLCGVPQRRKRLFLIGRKGAKNDFLRLSLLTGLSVEALTVRNFLGEKLGTDFYYRHPRSYERRGIFSIDEPSPTIRGVNRPIPPDYKFHPGDATTSFSRVRPLTTLERALLQTFPSAFKWEGPTKSTLEQLIGNAVPVNLAEYVGKRISKYADNMKLSRKLEFESV